MEPVLLRVSWLLFHPYFVHHVESEVVAFVQICSYSFVVSTCPVIFNARVLHCESPGPAPERSTLPSRARHEALNQRPTIPSVDIYPALTNAIYDIRPLDQGSGDLNFSKISNSGLTEESLPDTLPRQWGVWACAGPFGRTSIKLDPKLAKPCAGSIVADLGLQELLLGSFNSF